MKTELHGFAYDYEEFEGETKEEIADDVAHSMMCGIETYAQIVAQALPFMDGDGLAAAREVERAIWVIATGRDAAFAAVGRAVVENPGCILELPDAAEVPGVFAAAAYADAGLDQRTES